MLLSVVHADMSNSLPVDASVVQDDGSSTDWSYSYSGSTSGSINGHVFNPVYMSSFTTLGEVSILFTTTYTFDVAAGETIGLLNFAVLSSVNPTKNDKNDKRRLTTNTEGDEDILNVLGYGDSLRNGNLLPDSEYLVGLEADELESVANFSAVPEPSTAMFILISMARCLRARFFPEQLYIF